MTSQELKGKLDAMKWSYTRLSALDDCPYAWRLTYIDQVEGRDNAFAQWGVLMHSLLEKNALGELALEDMIPEYEARFYFEITEPFPYDFKGNDMTQTYYNDGIGFLFQYQGIPDNYKVIGAEIKVETTIGDNPSYPFVGIIDLLLQDEDGGYVIVDHKSKKAFKSKREQAEYTRQLYMYSRFVYEQYGGYPKELVFNLIRGNEWISTPFDIDKYNEAQEWALKVIDKAYNTHNFMTKLELNAIRKEKFVKYDKPDYFCNNICDHRFHCEALNGGLT